MSSKTKRLLYISEVPAELSFAGATLVYRLLEKYPSDQLLIIQTGVSVNNRRLPGIRYVELKNKWVPFLKRLRLRKIADALNILDKQRIGRDLKKEIDAFRPEAVVSVTFNLSWLTAYRISVVKDIPLLLLLHDDLLTTEHYGGMHSYVSKLFKKVYLHARSCFCISPQMEEYYRAQYGKKGLVIYPSRGKNDLTYQVDWSRVPAAKSLNFCYAGSIGTTDFLPMMNDLAEILHRHGHTLSLFVNSPKEMVRQYEYLAMPHVKFEPMVHPDELKKYMADHVDVNVLLNSFIHEDLFKLNFSSKIVDYTAVDLPVLFWGAPSSGIMRWALGNGYQCVITETDRALVEQAVIALQDRQYRRDLAGHLHRLVESTFGYQRNFDVFISNLN